MPSSTNAVLFLHIWWPQGIYQQGPHPLGHTDPNEAYKNGNDSETFLILTTFEQVAVAAPWATEHWAILLAPHLNRLVQGCLPEARPDSCSGLPKSQSSYP